MSLLETYQSRKTLFVNKLTNKGVEASNNDGLTTLINKIDSIDGGSNNGVLLFADKDIVVTEGIVKLGAIALNNGKLVNEPISIIDILYSNSLINDGQNTFDFENESAVGEYSKCESNENGFLLQLNSAYLSSVVFDFTKYKYIISFKAKVLDDEPNICYMSVGTTSSYNYPMSVDVTTTNLPQNISSDQDGFYDIRWEININNNKIYVNDNLYLNDDDVDYTGFDNHYLWFISNDWTNIYKNLTITQVFGESEFGATNGIYYGKGIGNKEFITKCGNFVSNTYQVTDCSFYDIGTTGTVNTDWTNKNATLSSQGGTDGTLFSNSGSSFGTFYANKNSSSGTGWSDLYDYSANCKIEFDVVSVTGADKTSIVCNDGTTPFQVFFNTYNISANSHVIITVEATRYKVKVDDTEANWINHSLATNFGVAFRLNDSTSSVKFKNFEIYPV